MKQNRNHDVTDLGARHLARLKNIDSLDVTNTGITDQGRYLWNVWIACGSAHVSLLGTESCMPPHYQAQAHPHHLKRRVKVGEEMGNRDVLKRRDIYKMYKQLETREGS